jgi:hypothetical protein
MSLADRDRVEKSPSWFAQRLTRERQDRFDDRQGDDRGDNRRERVRNTDIPVRIVNHHGLRFSGFRAWSRRVFAIIEDSLRFHRLLLPVEAVAHDIRHSGRGGSGMPEPYRPPETRRQPGVVVRAARVQARVSDPRRGDRRRNKGTLTKKAPRACLGAGLAMRSVSSPGRNAGRFGRGIIKGVVHRSSISPMEFSAHHPGAVRSRITSGGRGPEAISWPEVSSLPL